MNPNRESLKEIRKSYKVPWYRCPIDAPRLRALAKRSDLKGALQASGHLLLLVLTGALTYTLFLQRVWVSFALALFAHGTVTSFFYGLATHELAHGTVFRSKWLNGVFLRLFSLLSWFNFHTYKMSHTYHHLYTLHPRGDREVRLPIKPSLHPLYLLQLFTVNITGGPFSQGVIPVIGSTVKLALTGRFGRNVNPGGGAWMEAVYEDQEKERRKAVAWARTLVLFHLAVIGVSTALGLWLLPVLITFSPFIANWWHYFIGITMHTGLRDNVPDFRQCVRTIRLDPFSEFLYWRMNYHTEHHMFAAVPCYSLPELHRTVASDMPEPRTLVGAWREMRETWKRQQKDPGYQYHTPLPPAAGMPQKQDPLGASLGDLAPEELT